MAILVKLNLNTWQRMMCVQALNAQAGHISTIRKALKLLEILELDEAERVDVGMVQIGDEQFTWKDQAHRFELEVADRELAAFLKRAVAGYGNWPVLQARDTLDLFEQLGIEAEE